MKKLLFVLLALALQFVGKDTQAQSCAVPTGLNANPIYDFQVTLNWNAVPGALFYNIRFRQVGTIPFTTTSSTPAIKVISGLTPGTQYEFQVQTRCTVGTSAFSSLVTFTTTNSCGAPTGLGTSVLAPFNATITWNPVAQALFYTTRYKKRDVVGPFTTGTNLTNSKALAGLSQGTWYIFQVATNCPGGQSAFSGLDSFLTPCAFLETYNSPGTFADTNNQVEGNYVLYNDTNYCKRIASLLDTVGGNALGSTIISQTVNTGVYTSVDPNYIYGRRRTTVTPTSNGHGRLILNFSQEDFTQYNANNPTYMDLPDYGDSNHIWIPRIKIAKWLGTSKTYITPDSMKWNGTNNEWMVYITQNSISGTYYFYTMPDCNGISVSGLNVTNVLGSSFKANWTQITNPWFGWYSLQYKPVSSGTWIDGGTSAYTTANKTLIGLTPNTSYEVQIRFHCSSLSEGLWSNSVYFTTLNTCWAPTSTSVSNITGTGAKINWPAAPGALFYTVKYRTSAGPGPWMSGTTNTNNKILTGLTTSTQYDAQVGTNCAGWLSPLTPIVQFTTLASRPGQTTLEEELNTNTIEVFPNPVKDQLSIQFNDDAATGYELKVTDMNGRVVSSAHVQSVEGMNEFSVDASAFAKGVYSIQLTANTKQLMRRKFVKE